MRKVNLRNVVIRAAAVCMLMLAGPGILAVQAAGWQQEGGNWKYYTDENQQLVLQLTPDGYFVDEQGNWRQLRVQILDLSIAVPDRYCPPAEMKDWSRILEELNQVKNKVYQALGDKRSFHLYEDTISYRRVSGGREKDLIRLCMNEGTQGYRLELSADLGKRSGKRTLASTYDYEVFRFLLTKISHYPDQVTDAIYQSWQGQNTWGINREQYTQVMDSIIRCGVENGKGIYEIYPMLP